MLDFDHFDKKCRERGLSAIMRTDVHWQVARPDGTPLVNYWPTTQKVLAHNAKQGAKSQHGGAVDAIALAERLMQRTATTPVNSAPPPAKEQLRQASMRVVCVQYEGRAEGVAAVLATLLESLK